MDRRRQPPSNPWADKGKTNNQNYLPGAPSYYDNGPQTIMRWSSQPLVMSDNSYETLSTSTTLENASYNDSPTSMISDGISFQTPDNRSMTFYTDPQLSYEDSKPTPSSLGWFTGSELLQLYKFVVERGKEPYFELLPEYRITRQIPGKVYLDPPRNHVKNQLPCQYPDCSGPNIFKRPADLERHYRNVHASVDQREQYPCDYPPCQRAKAPFMRKDHFRDHLRDYHKEDIGCAKGEKLYDRKKWAKLQEEWVAERKIDAEWWRCLKCLHRVKIAESGYECQACKTPFDIERRKRIEVVREKLGALAAATLDSTAMEDVRYFMESSTATYPVSCAACGDAGFVWNKHRETWDVCQTCEPSQITNMKD